MCLNTLMLIMRRPQTMCVIERPNVDHEATIDNVFEHLMVIMRRHYTMCMNTLI